MEENTPIRVAENKDSVKHDFRKAMLLINKKQNLTQILGTTPSVWTIIYSFANYINCFNKLQNNIIFPSFSIFPVAIEEFA